VTVPLQVDLDDWGEQSFGPYCGHRDPWSLFSLYHYMNIRVIKFSTTQGRFTFHFQLHEGNFTSLGKPHHLIRTPNSTTTGGTFSLANYQPIYSNDHYKMFAWLIRGNYLDKLIIMFRVGMGNLTSTGATLNLYDGPSSLDDMLLMFKGLLNQSVSSKSFSTKTFQSLIVVRSNKLHTFTLQIDDKKIHTETSKMYMLNLTHKKRSVIEESNCDMDSSVIYCMWKVNAPRNSYIHLTLKELEHSGPEDYPQCIHSGIVLQPLPNTDHEL